MTRWLKSPSTRIDCNATLKTDRVHPCPIDSIRRLFQPSIKTLLYSCVCFSKSHAIRLLASRVGVHKNGSSPSVSDRLDSSTFLFYPLRIHYSTNTPPEFQLIESMQTLDDPTQFGCVEKRSSLFWTLLKECHERCCSSWLRNHSRAHRLSHNSISIGS